MTNRARVSVLVGGCAISVAAAVPAFFGPEAPFGTTYSRAGAVEVAVHVLVGLSFIVLGVVAWSRYSRSLTGHLMIVVGFLWFISDLAWVQEPLPFTVAHYAGAFYLGVIAHLYIAFPSGRLASRAGRLLVIAIYGWFVAGLAVEAAFWDPREHTLGPVTRNLLMVRPDLQLNQTVARWNGVIAATFVVIVLLMTVRRWRRASPPGRRALAPVATASAPLFVGILAVILDGAISLPHGLHVAIVDLAPLALAALPIGFVVGLLRSQLAYTAVGRLLIDLGGTGRPEPLQEVIARTLGDPTVELGFWIPEHDGFVDHAGRRLDTTAPGPGRDVKFFTQDGKATAALVYDASLEEDPELLESVAAAARLSLDNERLQAQVRAQLEEVKESRARILAAGDAARSRIERDLHDGAQQRLVMITLAVRTARAKLGAEGDRTVRRLLDETDGELRTVLRELRELAHGIHPAILADEGLGPALESLVHRCPVPTTLHHVCCGRLPPSTEATLYFVVAEALANVAKHSEAKSARVSVRQHDGHVVAAVIDDGRGGANESAGSGLRGLRDRVETLGGRFEVRCPADGGTVLEAEIPCESS